MNGILVQVPVQVSTVLTMRRRTPAAGATVPSELEDIGPEGCVGRRMGREENGVRRRLGGEENVGGQVQSAGGGGLPHRR